MGTRVRGGRGLRRLLVLSLGGTISCSRNEFGYNEPARSAEEVVAAVPEIHELADITTLDVATTGSIGISRQNLIDLVDAIYRGIEEGYDGILITHGTDVIEETAYVLALQVPRRIPIVLTGAMRTATQLGADGPANVFSAAAVAIDPAAAGLGPAVVIQDQIHLARWVSKVHTSAVAAFASPGLGPVGNVTEGRVHIWALPAHPDLLGRCHSLQPRVDIAWITMDAEGHQIEALIGNGDGIVVAGSGGGHVPPKMMDAVRQAVGASVPVVLASRTGAGAVLERTYAGEGTETDLIAAGAVPAGALDPLKARWRLTVALALGIAPADAFPVE